MTFLLTFQSTYLLIEVMGICKTGIKRKTRVVHISGNKISGISSSGNFICANCEKRNFRLAEVAQVAENSCTPSYVNTVYTPSYVNTVYTPSYVNTVYTPQRKYSKYSIYQGCP